MTVFPCPDPVDIAVIVRPRILTQNLKLEPAGSKQVIITQEVYFLGFPFGMSIDGVAAFGPYPMPIAKHGILSAFNDGVLLVDAYNNPGFSGAPIVFRDMYQSAPVFYVLGVVQGFYPDLVRVTTPEPIRPGQDISHVDEWRKQEIDGVKVVLKDEKQLVPLNSGILKGYGISYAVDMIHEHPVGPQDSPSQ